MPTPVLSLDSPFLKLFRSNPNYERLRVFGCQCFPWLRPYTKHKLEERSRPCVFLGYSLTQTAYLCLDIPNNRLYTSRHIQFDEETFPFAKSNQIPQTIIHEQSSPSLPPATVISPPCQILHTDPPSQHLQPQTEPPATSVPSQTEPPATSIPSQTELPATASISQVPISSLPFTTLSHVSEPTVPHQNGPEPEAQLTQQNSPLRGPLSSPPNSPLPQPTISPVAISPSSVAPPILPQSPPPHLIPSPENKPPPENPNQPANQEPENTHKMTTRSKNNISKPKTKTSLTVRVSKSPPKEPTSVTQALKDKEWRFAMSDEFDAQQRNHTWDLVPPNSTQHLVGCRWVFKLKYLPNGNIDKYKARLVAKGFNQQYGIDYAETFSPVIKSTTIRLVLNIAVNKDWQIKQLDVNNAFLQGTLTEEVYMAQPPGFIDKDQPSHVCRLRKAIYGLKQAQRAWYMELKQHLLNIGFINSLADTSLFIKHNGKSILYLLVYVDDIIVTGSDSSAVASVLSSLAERFSIKDPTDLHYFLGIEATRTKQGLHLMQRKYVMDLLTRTNMVDAKPVATPLPTTPKLTLHGGTKLDDATEYRSIVGSLQYLAFTRPDIAFAVNRLSQFMHQPTTDHWQATKRVLRYLAGTSTHEIFLKANSPMLLHAYSDADWAGDNDDYVSTNAYVIYLGHNPISSSSKKQRGVARSSTEAEYRAVANTASEVQWLCSLLSELHIRLDIGPTIFCDNIGATYLCANPVFHSRMRHIAFDFHFVRNMIQSRALRVSHVSTHDQLADALTKPLSRQQFHTACSKIGVRQLPPS